MNTLYIHQWKHGVETIKQISRLSRKRWKLFSRMGLSLRMWIVSILVLTQLVHGALSWGDDGHYAVCKITQGYFEEETVAAVKKLLPESADGELAAVCTWPDEIKKLPQWRWTGALHFADTPDYKCNYEYSRDCPKDWCVTGAIFNYTNQLLSASENSQSIVHYNLTEALMFLSHYMGDIHQPLHEGFIGDLGGNRIKVHWYNDETNLHRNGWSNDVPSWESCQLNQTACPNPYASESIDLACKYAYRNATAGTTLGDYYFASRLPVVEKRLAQGGIRLAATLNRIFSGKSKLARA